MFCQQRLLLLFLHILSLNLTSGQTFDVPHTKKPWGLHYKPSCGLVNNQGSWAFTFRMIIPEENHGYFKPDVHVFTPNRTLCTVDFRDCSPVKPGRTSEGCTCYRANLVNPHYQIAVRQTALAVDSLQPLSASLPWASPFGCPGLGDLTKVMTSLPKISDNPCGGDDGSPGPRNK